MAATLVAKKVAQTVANIFLGVIALLFSSAVNALLAAVLVVRFIVMTALRSLSTVVEFVGETTINVFAFTRDTLFAILTFVVQTATSIILFVLNQFVSVWRLVVTLVTVLLGETCYLTKKGVYRVFDAATDLMGSLATFARGMPALMKVVKAQGKDVKTGVDVKGVFGQAISTVIDTLVYILAGDEGKITDGLIPNVFIEVFKALPLTVDLAKLVLLGTWDISKETLSVAFSSLTELLSLTEVFSICKG
jgi:hypothetical protein